jgi:hypothetical protein
MMRTSSAILVLLLGLLGSVLPGCKAKEVTKADPQMVKDLADCRRNLDEKDKYIAKLQEENTRLQMQKGGGEVVVVIEGGNATVRAGQTGNQQIDPKVAAAGATEFLGIVEKSRGSIQKCYEQALKKSAGLHGQEVNVTVQATFTPQGALSGASSAPSLGEPFDGCLKQVAQKWTVKGSPVPTTYRQVVQLKPS